MRNYVVSTEVNLFNGVLAGSIPFEQGLNIISGENGTCKTNLLREIKAGRVKTNNPTLGASKIQAFSPKRNAERKTIERIFQELRSQSKDFAFYINNRNQAQIKDDTFDTYPSAGELYYYVYENSLKDGGNQIAKMNEVTIQFNMIIKKIFHNYDLISDWDDKKGTPRIELRKYDTQNIRLEFLSCGEQEILALVLNLYASRDSYDVFLIDEPEIHLNWHLEEKLFGYLDWFCTTYDKQVIVATHSRVIFKREFLKRTQFLYWNGDHISFSKQIPEGHLKKIAGEAIDIIKLGDFNKITFFVEDSHHAEIIEKLANVLGKQITTSECGNSSNVISLFKLSLNEGGWRNSFFVIDGDNQANPFSDRDQFIHLDKYCIENYLLNFKVAARITNKNEIQIREVILRAITKNREKMLRKNKYFEFLVDRLTLDDITETSLDRLDASEILPTYLQEIETDFPAYLDHYIRLLFDEKMLDSIFPQQLMRAIGSY